MTHQLGVAGMNIDYVDKRRLYRDDFETRAVSGGVVFTANAGGTTTTLVGVNADPTSGNVGVNVVRKGDEFKLFNSAGVLKEEKVFRVTTVAVAGSTTVTFTPAAATATVSGDNYRLVGMSNNYSNNETDRRLIELGFSALYVSKMTENDKLYQIRQSDDPGSI
jgi:hypothetical protein